MPILSSPLQSILAVPVTTRSFTAATVASSLLYYFLQWRNSKPHTTPYLTLIPGQSLFYPWTLLTAGLVETTIFELISSLVFVPISLRYLERLWGSLETLKFILVTTAISNLLSFLVNWAEFLLFRNDIFLYGIEYHGQMALQCGILVAFTQLIPEYQIQIFGIFRVRVKRLPMVYVTLSTIMVLLGFQSPWISIQWGWLIAWTYLRFYKKNKIDSNIGDTYGDRSETFAFVHWFPPFVHTPVTWLSNFVYALATRLHLIPVPASDIEMGGYSQVPGGHRAEAERRRALALKALDQRTTTTTAAPKDSVVQSTQAASPSPTSDAGRFHTNDRHRAASDIGDDLTDSDGKGKVKEEA